MDQEAKSQRRISQLPRMHKASFNKPQHPSVSNSAACQSDHDSRPHRIACSSRIVFSMLRTCVLFLSFQFGNHANATRFVAYFSVAPGEKMTPIADDLLPLPVAANCLPGPIATAWKSYTDVWAAHHRSPDDPAVRIQLGLTSGDASAKPSVIVGSGRSMATTMRLSILEMRRYETEHFTLLSDCTADRATEVILKLERFYHVWTQLFFPLWKERDHWDHSQAASPRRNTTKHRVVLFANAARYQQILSSEGPIVSRSTGFYSDLKRIAFFHDGSGDDSATRAHELTHQLMSEATDARPRSRPGDRRDFWLVEGIACFMESTMFHDHYATIGGWQASRLSFARHRVLSFGDELPLSLMQGEGRSVVQQREDLSRWYSFAAAYTHRIIDEDNGAGLLNLLHRLGTVYQIRILPLAGCDQDFSQEALTDYLKLSDQDITPVTHDQLVDLCLSRTDVTRDGLEAIAPQSALKWLELAFIPIGNEDVVRLSPQSSTIEQLNLEATGIDDSLGDWIAGANRLREVDFSSTRIGDPVIMRLPKTAPIETLWLTGSLVTDGVIDSIVGMEKLQRVDLQRTQVTQAGVLRLKAARPDLKVNPLEIASP